MVSNVLRWRFKVFLALHFGNLTIYGSYIVLVNVLFITTNPIMQIAPLTG